MSSQIESVLNTFSATSNESMSQQQQYQEQKDNFSEEISSNDTPTELLEIPQLSSTNSTISPSSILDSNCNSSDSSASNQSDFDTSFNPISFLNTMHQKLKKSEPPVYSYSHHPVTGQFYCKVEFCGQTYENKDAKPKKKQAKEEASSIAMKDLSLRMPEITASIRQELIRAHISQRNNISNNNNQIAKCQLASTPHPMELVPKSVHWYNKQEALANSSGQTKRPCVLLLEFCQMHKLGSPTYNKRDDGRGLYLFDCIVSDRIFTPDMSFWKQNDAKDHVSKIAFECLYKEFCEQEFHEIQGRYGIPHIQPPNVAFSPVYSNVNDGSYVYYP